MAHTVATVEIVGGHMALDLVNTVSWRLDPERRRDYLADAGDLATWLQRVGVGDGQGQHVLAEATEAAADRALLDVRALREELFEVLSPLTSGTSAESLVVTAALNARLAEAVASSRLAGSPLRWRVEPAGPDDVVHLLALEVLDLLTAHDLGRLRLCAGRGCGWFFLDRSRSNTRRWCSAEDCGNRERARRHYARHRTGATSG